MYVFNNNSTSLRLLHFLLLLPFFFRSFLRVVVAFTPSSYYYYNYYYDSSVSRTSYRITTRVPTTITSSSFGLQAKKRRKENLNDNLFDWYQKIDVDANPNAEDIFWEEMERQKLVSQSVESVTNANDANGSSKVENVVNGNSSNNGMNSQSQMGSYAMNASSGSSSTVPQNADSILSQFRENMVSNNWIGNYGGLIEDEDLVMLQEQQEAQINAAWESLYGDDEDEILDDEDDEKVAPNGLNIHIFDDSDDDEEDRQAEEELVQRLESITIRSREFDLLKRNKRKLEGIKNRKPDSSEGMEYLWIGAVDSPSAHNIRGALRLYGVELADNFGEWEYGPSIVTDQQQTIEDLASFKARELFKSTGLPCVSSQSMWEVEPARSSQPGPGKNRAAFSTSFMSPRTMSGYRFNDIDDRIDTVVEALKPVSDPARKTRFRSCVCFYDGNMETYTYGEVEVDLFFCKSTKCYISLSSAITDMVNVLKTTFDFEYQKWLKSKVKEAFIGYRGAGIKLRDRVLKEGRVLPNNIIDVSRFMDSMVDVDLMKECGIELAHHFLDVKATKILTIATTGLILAIPMASELQVPVVYARKERSIVMADTYQASYSSNTVGANKMLHVAKSHIHADDRVLIVDDFLSAGSSQEALMRIISDAGATPVGVAVLIEKCYDSGRKALSGFNVPVQSLVRVASVRDGVITLFEEEGFKEDEILSKGL